MLLKEFKSAKVIDGNIRYEDIFSEDAKKQKQVTAIYKELFELRNNIIEKTTSQATPV